MKKLKRSKSLNDIDKSLRKKQQPAQIKNNFFSDAPKAFSKKEIEEIVMAKLKKTMFGAMKELFSDNDNDGVNAKPDFD